jgi:Putative DNA-binding domain
VKLTELQSAFQEAILGEPGDLLAEIRPSRRLDSAARFAVYHDAYRSRLAEFLRNDYPILFSVLGEEAFAELAAAYVAATPSTDPNARWYGQKLPMFLRQTPPWADMRALGDLALLERTLADAFDAENSAPLDPGALAEFAAEDQPQLAFAFAPSVTLLQLIEGTMEVFAAAVEGTETMPPQSEAQEFVLVWRDLSLEPLYRLLDEEEALAFDAAKSGATLDEICGLLALRHDRDAAAGLAAGFLARWFGDGLVAGLSIDAARPRRGGRISPDADR